MSSDDPIELPQVENQEDQQDDDLTRLVEQHLNSIRKNRHFNHNNHHKKDHSNVIQEIYQERLKAERDTVDQTWFEQGEAGGGVYSTDQGGPSSSKDRLTDAVKLNVRRVGSKATDTFRKITNQSTRRKSIFSSFGRNTITPKITIQEQDGEDVDGIPLQGVTTNSSLNTINLPPFDLSRFQSTSSSQSTLSSLTTSPPTTRSRTPQPRQGRSRIIDPLDFEPPTRVPTPPPFPSSPLPPPSQSLSRPTSPQSLSPSLYQSYYNDSNNTTSTSTSKNNTPFHNLISLPPLSETESANAPTFSTSPTTSLRNFPISLSRTTSPSTTNAVAGGGGAEEGGGALLNTRRRTLTVENDYNPPSRRDTLTGGLSFRSKNNHNQGGNNHSMISHLKNSLHLKQIDSNLSTTTTTTTTSSSSRPTTPPPLSNRRPVFSRSPTEMTSGTTTGINNKKRAKEELQRLLSKRNKFLFGRNNNKSRLSVIPNPPGQSENEGGELEGSGVEGGGIGKGIERAIVERLKVLGALVEEEEKIQTDILWEHQRGLLVFGLPKFSSAALFQFDPQVWTNGHLKPSPFTPHDFPCKPYWKWLDQEFMVDIGGDVDEEGWSYATFFHSKGSSWRGEPSLFRSFVRRRKWIRSRVYIPLHTTTSSKSVANRRRMIQEEEEGYTTINGTKVSLSEQVENNEDEEDDDDEEEDFQLESEVIVDLKSACECLPLTKQEKNCLFYSISSASSSSSNRDMLSPPPCNPFIPFRIILEHSKQNNQGQRGNSREFIWRQGIIEINEIRIKQVLKRVARIDRERLKLWKIWLQADDSLSLDDDDKMEREEGFECSEWSEWRIGEKYENWTEWLEERGESNEEERGGEETRLGWKIKEEEEEEKGVEGEDFADPDRGDNQSCKRSNRSSRKSRKKRRGGAREEEEGVGKPDLEDVWDLIESRLDNILSMFDYHLTRLSFLRLLISCHPLASTPTSTSTSQSNYTHRHEGYDLPLEERKRRKELEWEKRLKWVLGVKEEIQRMEGGSTGGPPSVVVVERGREVPGLEEEEEEKKKKGGVERSRSERRNRKGKQKAIFT
ncbi:hypothetical protein JCM5350_000721 [Sporobolomyces pararoseus]